MSNLDPKKKTALVVKTQRLSESIQRLSLGEIRVLQLAIVGARETGRGLSPTTPLVIKATDYAEMYDVTRQAAYDLMLAAEQKLFARYFTIIDPKYNLPRKSHWIQDVLYLKDEGSIQITFTRTVVDEITRIDGAKDFFTKYTLENTVNLTSSYAMRLYEMLCKWRDFQGSMSGLYPLETLRGQLGVGDNEYADIGNFKRRVLDVAVSQINEHTDLKVSYEQEKKGRRVSGFRFKVKPKPAMAEAPKKAKKKTPEAYEDQVIDHLNMTRKAASAMTDKMAFLPDDQLPDGMIKLPPPKRANAMLHKLSDPEKWQELRPQLDAVGYGDLLS